MSLAFLGAASCRGCGCPVNRWHDGVREVIRDRSTVAAHVHLCAEPEQRECVEMGLLDLMDCRCPDCGDPDVAWSSWGRLVEFPKDALCWAEAWVGALSEHVCGATERNNWAQQPIAGVEVPSL